MWLHAGHLLQNIWEELLQQHRETMTQQVQAVAASLARTASTIGICDILQPGHTGENRNRTLKAEFCYMGRPVGFSLWTPTSHEIRYLLPWPTEIAHSVDTLRDGSIARIASG